MNRILTLFVFVLLLSFTGLSHAAVVNVAGAGSSDAATADNTYFFAAGEYLYTIAGFNSGDVLAFPAGPDPTVENTSGTDGILRVYFGVNQQTVSVTLTGIPAAQDNNVFGLNSFKAVFGATSIIVATAPLAGDCNNTGSVSIAEVQSAINMFLGLNPVLACVDADGSNNISIAEVQKVINSYLGL